MRKLLFALMPVLLLSIYSCEKDNNDPPPPSNPSGPTPFTPPTPSSAKGAFVGIKMQYTMTNDQIPIPVSIESEIAVASVGGSSGNVDAGTVEVNGVALDKNPNNSYVKMGTLIDSVDLDLGNSIEWSVSGAGSVAGFTYNHTDAFPSYTDSLPSNITRANGLSLNLSSASNADSVYVFVAAGDKYVLKSYAGNATNITIAASDLNTLPAVSNNTAFLQVLPVKFRVANVGGEDYVFIKQRAIVRAINID